MKLLLLLPTDIPFTEILGNEMIWRGLLDAIQYVSEDVLGIVVQIADPRSHQRCGLGSYADELV